MSDIVSTGGGHNHPAGCGCPWCVSTVHAEADVTLPTPAPNRTVDSYATEVNELVSRWLNEPDVYGTLNDDVYRLSCRVLQASEPDRPGYRHLEESVEKLHTLLNAPEYAEDADDAAEEVVFTLEDITDASNMDVVEDGQGGHLRVADGKRAHTCVCGNGYATERVLKSHQVETGCGDDREDEIAQMMGNNTPTGDLTHHIGSGDTSAVEKNRRTLEQLLEVIGNQPDAPTTGKPDVETGLDDWVPDVEPDVDDWVSDEEADRRAGWHYPTF